MKKTSIAVAVQGAYRKRPSQAEKALDDRLKKIQSLVPELAETLSERMAKFSSSRIVERMQKKGTNDVSTE